jgi:hypothetical protein
MTDLRVVADLSSPLTPSFVILKKKPSRSNSYCGSYMCRKKRGIIMLILLKGNMKTSKHTIKYEDNNILIVPWASSNNKRGRR